MSVRGATVSLWVISLARICADRGLTGARTTAVEGPGWPPPESFPVRECLLIVLNEEWHPRLYAERDLAALEPEDWVSLAANSEQRR